MTPATTEAGALLAEARRTKSAIPGLPRGLLPRSVAEAEAIQRATFARLGFSIGGWKVGRAGSVVFVAPLPREAITNDSASPIRVPSGTRVELELALRLREAMPSDGLALGRLPETADLVLLIEFVRSRYAPGHAPSDLEKVADCVSNEYAVVAAPTGSWTPADLVKPDARLLVDDVELGRCGTAHPALPLEPLITAWRDRCLAEGRSPAAGEIVTLGSLTGVAALPPTGGTLVGTVAGRGEIRSLVAVEAPHETKET